MTHLSSSQRALSRTPSTRSLTNISCCEFLPSLNSFQHFFVYFGPVGPTFIKSPLNWASLKLITPLVGMSLHMTTLKPLIRRGRTPGVVIQMHNTWQVRFDLPRQQWSLLNRFRTEQGHCGACRRKWRLSDTDLCPCGETQTMSHIVESCPLTKLNGGLSRLHSADEDAVSWLTSYGSWHTYEKKKTETWRYDRAYQLEELINGDPVADTGLDHFSTSHTTVQQEVSGYLLEFLIITGQFSQHSVKWLTLTRHESTFWQRSGRHPDRNQE